MKTSLKLLFLIPTMLLFSIVTWGQKPERNIHRDKTLLKNVTGFKTVQCGAVPDKKIEKAENNKL